MLYGDDRRKHITDTVLSYLDTEAIALWWMDDGNVTPKYTYPNYKTEKVLCGYTLRLFTYLSKEENLLIRKYFIDNYDMYWNVVPADGDKSGEKFMLRCGTTEGRKFLNIIREYIVKRVPSMAYKVINI